jgi:hypothetical protein
LRRRHALDAVQVAEERFGNLIRFRSTAAPGAKYEPSSSVTREATATAYFSS